MHTTILLSLILLFSASSIITTMTMAQTNQVYFHGFNNNDCTNEVFAQTINVGVCTNFLLHTIEYSVEVLSANQLTYKEWYENIFFLSFYYFLFFYFFIFLFFYFFIFTILAEIN